MIQIALILLLITAPNSSPEGHPQWPSSSPYGHISLRHERVVGKNLVSGLLALAMQALIDVLDRGNRMADLVTTSNSGTGILRRNLRGFGNLGDQTSL